jgi:hypothetical protein
MSKSLKEWPTTNSMSKASLHSNHANIKRKPSFDSQVNVTVRKIGTDTDLEKLLYENLSL